MATSKNALAPQPANSLAYGPRNLMGTQMLRGPNEAYLRQQFPGLYGALGGLLATAPDVMEGSVLDPNTAAVRQGAEYTFPIGTALAMLPAAAPAQKVAMTVGRAGERLAERAVPQVMDRGGLLAEMMQGMSNRTVSPLDVYHGTPHTLPPTPRNPLGEFDASKIGTGEGAQAYGLGIYTAENPAVATGYKIAAKNTAYTIDGKNAIDAAYADRTLNKPVKYLQDFKGDVQAAIKSAIDDGQPQVAQDIQKLFDSGRIKPMPTGNLYKVDLPDEKIAQMIDYDKPMAEQRNVIEKMRQALVGPDSPLSRSQQFQINDYLNDSVRMRNLYPQSVVDLNDPRIVERLRQVGIPGVKYLDQQSRNAGGWHLTSPDNTVRGKWMLKSSDYNSNGVFFDSKKEAEAALKEKLGKETRNFVTFPGEEKNLTILERNGQKATRTNNLTRK